MTDELPTWEARFLEADRDRAFIWGKFGYLSKKNIELNVNITELKTKIAELEKLKWYNVLFNSIKSFK